MKLHPSVKVTWGIANLEACLSCRARIEPVHFLIAAMSVIDGLFEDAAEVLRLSRYDVKDVFRIALECRTLLGMSDDDITVARRGLRRALQPQEEVPEVTSLHRSGESRFLFQKANRVKTKSGTEAMTLTHLLAAMLEDIPEEARPFLASVKFQHADASDDWPEYLPDPGI